MFFFSTFKLIIFLSVLFFLPFFLSILFSYYFMGSKRSLNKNDISDLTLFLFSSTDTVRPTSSGKSTRTSRFTITTGVM